MHVVTDLAPYEDDDGNRIECDPEAVSSHLRITFRGSRNVVRIGRRARLGRVDIVFDCSDGVVEIAEGGGALSINVRVGQDSRIILGRNVTSTSVVGMSATEGTTIRIGDDVMFASENQVRADDGHPIFDVRTGKRVNVSRDITIGNHVWIGWGTWVLGGSVVGDGSVLGTGAILKGRIPNNVVAVGIPAKVIRKDIAWERPHLSLVAPYYKPDASTIKKSKYWNLTTESSGAHPVRRAKSLGTLIRRFGGRVRRKLSRMLKR